MKTDNRIKTMAKRHYHESFKDNETFFTYIENEFTEEFKICYEETELTNLKKESILILLRLNLKHNIIPLHQFGLNVNYTKLI